MRVVALISGGKDSCYNMMQCVSAGHTIVALANLMPADDGVSDERDSFMYQTVGHQVVALYREAVGVPLYRLVIQGSSLRTEREYTHTDGDEVEDLYGLLKLVQEKENVEGVSVGAILSDYQRVRVENVCARLQLQPLTYLWRRDQAALLSEMISTGVHAIIIKVAAIGLDPEKHLGKPLVEMEAYLKQLSEKFGVHICGEGGEYETLTTDCPLFKKKIVIDAAETVIHSADAFAPVGYLRVTRMHTEEKTPGSGGRLPSLGTCPCQKAIEEMTEELEYSDKRRDVQGECPSHADRSCQPEPDCLLSHSVRTSAGFQWLAGLTALPSPHPDVQTQTRQVFTLLERELQQKSWSLEHVVLVHLYLSEMKNFSKINSVYTTFFTRSPPARVCVQASLPAGQLLRMDVLLHNRMCVEEEEDVTSHRDTLHVQSISHWAPANIGPYSQAVQVCGAVFGAGQVALVPCSMCMVEGPVELQARLCFRHTKKVLSAVRSPLTLAHVLQAHLYVTDPQQVEPVIAAWRHSGLRDAQVSVAVVASLPRAAQVEVEVVAVQDVPADRRCDVVVVETGGGPVECGLLRSSCGRYACVALSFRASADRPAPQVVVPALISAFTDLLHKNPDLSPLCARVFYLRLDPDATDITTALQSAMSHIPHHQRPALILVPVEHLPDQRLLHVSCWISV